MREATRLADGTTIHVFRRVPVRIGSNSSSSSEGDSEFAKGHGTTAIAEYAGGYADAERTSKDRSEDGDEEEEEEDGKNGSETPNSGSGSGKGLGWVRGLNEA